VCGRFPSCWRRAWSRSPWSASANRAAISRIGAVEHVTVPWTGIALGCTALVAVANLVALVPERRARNDILAAQLRGE